MPSNLNQPINQSTNQPVNQFVQGAYSQPIFPALPLTITVSATKMVMIREGVMSRDEGLRKFTGPTSVEQINLVKKRLEL